MPPKVIPRYINPKVEELKRSELEKKAGSLNFFHSVENQKLKFLVLWVASNEEKLTVMNKWNMILFR